MGRAFGPRHSVRGTYHASAGEKTPNFAARNQEELALLKGAAQIVVMLPDEQATPEKLALLRRMTPERRLLLAEQLYWSAPELKAAWLRSRHTDWTEEQIGREVTRLFTNART